MGEAAGRRPAAGPLRCIADPLDGRNPVYLRTPIQIIHGHALYPDSPWTLTSTHQAQFCDVRDFPADYGDGEAADFLSVCVSEWDKAGIIYGKTAKECTREQVAR
jgi:hypothetical protein